ncbi:NAD(P)/FAD-dependent oxidoreductase [Chloroflexota bacterium]
MVKFERLFQPITIGNLELKNRLVQLAMELAYTTDGGKITSIYENFMLERAKGGVGLINTSMQTRWPGHKGFPGLYSDEFIPPFRKLIEGIHSHGAKFCAQLQLSHLWAKGEGQPVEIVGPSDVPFTRVEMPRTLTVDEIHQTINDYGKAARRARDAGFDAIEIHAGMGELECQFLSSFTNKRTDEYGGPIEKRTRFLLELIDSIKQNVGDDFPVICRFSAEEFMEGGNTLDESKYVARRAEEAGVCCINVQFGWHVSKVPMIQQWIPPAAWVHITHEIKQAINVPVIAAYRITHPEVAEQILAEGKADLIGMGRALIADPELPNKAREGCPEDIRHCIVCCRCVDNSMEYIPVTCSVNPSAGREPIKPAEKIKKVLVVGGGPSGMEAARIAALRGHKVMLAEKGRRLGGLMVLGSVLNKEIEPFVTWMRAQMKKLNIHVMTSLEVSPAVMQALDPDVVILAAGGTPITLDVPGVDGDNVINGHDIQNMVNGIPTQKGEWWQRLLWTLAAFVSKYFYQPALMRKALGLNLVIGKKVVIIGGQFAGCELALSLGEAGKQVTVIEESKRVGADIGMVVRWVALIKLREAGVQVETLTKVTEITDEGVKATREDGSSVLFGADTVFTIPGRSVQANTKLAQGLAEKAPVIYTIGDCADPGRIREATGAAYEVASKI